MLAQCLLFSFMRTVVNFCRDYGHWESNFPKISPFLAGDFVSLFSASTVIIQIFLSLWPLSFFFNFSFAARPDFPLPTPSEIHGWAEKDHIVYWVTSSLNPFSKTSVNHEQVPHTELNLAEANERQAGGGRLSQRGQSYQSLLWLGKEHILINAGCNNILQLVHACSRWSLLDGGFALESFLCCSFISVPICRKDAKPALLLKLSFGVSASFPWLALGSCLIARC